MLAGRVIGDETRLTIGWRSRVSVKWATRDSFFSISSSDFWKYTVALNASKMEEFMGISSLRIQILVNMFYEYITSIMRGILKFH